MSTKQSCRTMITRIINSATGIESAYVARMRLKRLILSCGRMIAKEYLIEEPELPGPFVPPVNSSKDDADIIHHCSELLEYAETLCQPSEPLESRWKSEWEKVIQVLYDLDELLAKDEATQRFGMV